MSEIEESGEGRGTRTPNGTGTGKRGFSVNQVSEIGGREEKGVERTQAAGLPVSSAMDIDHLSKKFFLDNLFDFGLKADRSTWSNDNPTTVEKGEKKRHPNMVC